MKIEITGNFNLNTGAVYTYTAKLDSPVESDKNLQVSFFGGDPGLFIISTNPYRFTNTLNVSIPKGKKEFKFTIIWLNEGNTEIWVTDPSSVGSPIVTKEVKVTVKTVHTGTVPENYEINDVIRIMVEVGKLPDKCTLRPEWEYDTKFTQKIGEIEYLQEHAYQQFKLLKWGNSLLKYNITVFDNTMGVGYVYCRGDITLIVPCPYSIVTTEKFTCPNSTITYKIEGLQGGDKIEWKEECKNAKLSSGQGTNTAIYIAQAQGEVEVSAMISYRGETANVSNKEVWAGKPTINTAIETTHAMTERIPVTIDASNEFFHYKGGISYAIESENAAFVTVTKTEKKFKIETTIPGNQKGEIKLRLKVSNDCGEVSNLHTITFDTLPGLEPAKAIDLFSAKEHEFTCGRTYDMVKYVGDLQTFQMFFTFTLERRATIMYIRPFCIEEKCLGFKKYDRQDEELKTPLYLHETSSTYMTIENMPSKEYMMVVDVERNHSDELQVILNGYIGGSSPTRPYVIEPDENGFEFSDCRNTETYYPGFYYKNEQGESIGSVAGTNNTYYILTLEKPMQLILHTACSKVSTEFHIMQGEPYDWKVLYHETGGNYNMEEIQADPEVSDELKSILLKSLMFGQTYIKRIFPTGEYRFVLNGIKKSNGGLFNGELNFNVIGLPIAENSFDSALELGKFIEHEFQIQTLLRNIQARIGMGVKKIYYHLTKDKNADLVLTPQNGSTYLPVELYNENKERIASFEMGTEAFRLDDVISNELYIVVNIENAPDDVLELGVTGIRRGTDSSRPYNWGVFKEKFTVEDKVDTADGAYYESFRYKDEGGEYPVIRPEANHVYYKLSIKKRMQLIIHTAQSDLGVMELHIMQGEPYDWTVLLYNDGGDFTPEEIANDPQLSDELKKELATLRSEQIYIKRIFEPGEYKLVLNGRKISNASRYNGGMNLHVIGQFIEENSFDTAYDLGTFKEHEFNFSRIIRDIQAYKESGIHKLYYQFHIEKNVNFILNANSKSSFLPIVLYDSNKEPIATSETEEGIRIEDMLGDRFYFTIDITLMAEDELTIEGKGMFRGRDPYISYNLGRHDKDFIISDTINTADGGFYETFRYTDKNGNLIYSDEPAANHVYYKITLQKEMQLIIHTTYSELPLTELHIMTGEPFGWHILYYKDYGCEGIEHDPDIPDEIKQNIAFGQICVKINLPAGEYKLVLNGTKRTNGGIRNGVLVTNIIGKVI